MKKIITSFLLALFSFLMPASIAYAGTDLTVTCIDEGPCQIAPDSTPLFDETGMLPGDEFQQILHIRNFDTNDTCDLILDVTDASPEEIVNLAERMFSAISDGSTTYFGELISGDLQDGYSYQDLYDTGTISLGSLAPLTSRDYTWYAEFDFNAGNEYQGSRSVFDFDINITCDGGGSVAGDSDDGGGEGEPLSEPGPASPPECHDSKPDGVAALTVTPTGGNSVNLSWTPVAGATHYALEFYRVSDGAAYGATNIGNVTSYSVTNLSGGGASYRFYIRPINGCMPGDLSNEFIVEPTGGVTEGRPLGEDGDVLGETTDEEQKEALAKELEEEEAGDVLGAIASCGTWRWYLPWILLLAQAVLILGVDYYLRKDEKLTKHYIAAGITLASIAIFYLVRECNCYGDAWWFWSWLCKWYWIVALLITAILQAVNYAFIEEAELKQKPSPSGEELKPESH